MEFSTNTRAVSKVNSNTCRFKHIVCEVKTVAFVNTNQLVLCITVVAVYFIASVSFGFSVKFAHRGCGGGNKLACVKAVFDASTVEISANTAIVIATCVNHACVVAV